MKGDALRLGIIGAGGAASLIDDAIPEASRVELRACTARTSESAHRFAAGRNITVHKTLENLLADDAVEAVYIATPNSSHHEQTQAALRAGKHVLVEKPMALSSTEARQTVKLAGQLGLTVGVGFHLRHSDIFRSLKHELEQGEIGAVSLVRAEWGMPLGVLQDWKDDPARAGAGSLMGLGVHVLDLVQWLTGGSLEAVAGVSDRTPNRLDRNYLALLIADDCLVELAVSRDHLLRGSFSVYGATGERHADGALTTRADGMLRDGEGNVLLRARRNPYASQLDAFADAIRGDAPFHADAADGASCVALTEALSSVTRHGRQPK